LGCSWALRGLPSQPRAIGSRLPPLFWKVLPTRWNSLLSHGAGARPCVRRLLLLRPGRWGLVAAGAAGAAGA
jgi:hypothetical protein